MWCWWRCPERNLLEVTGTDFLSSFFEVIFEAECSNLRWDSLRRRPCSSVEFAQIRIVQDRLYKPGQTQRGQCAVDLQHFARGLNLQ